MDQLIPIMCKLQEVFDAIDPEALPGDGQDAPEMIHFPCIVVVGSQSSGKSSVIESLVQRDFLPRGRDIVTRRPLVLQLTHISPFDRCPSVASASPSAGTMPSVGGGNSFYCSANFAYSSSYEAIAAATAAGNAPPLPTPGAINVTVAPQAAAGRSTTITTTSTEGGAAEHGSGSLTPTSLGEWGEFGHLPGRRFTDFAAIKREIEEETERVAGTNRAISSVPIHLRIYSPRVVNLTCVDLPGITKIPVGEQPYDIEAQIRSLVLEYITRPNAIILAITPANSDLANSDALKIAREVDPEGLRTIGVLTKLDLMDAGTHAADILTNRAAFRLKLGFVGVVNRSQHDIAIGKPIADSLRQEGEFFRSHKHYRAISHRCGSLFLAKELNKILLRHIREQLPELRSRINTLIVETQSELQALGDLGLPGQAHRGSVLLRIVTRYVSDFTEAIQGTFRSEASFDELRGGARINYIFNETFALAIGQFDASTGLTLGEVRNAIRNASGPRPALFVSEQSFEALVRKQISKLEAPAQECADLVFEEMYSLSHRIAASRKEYSRFPNLAAKIVAVAADLIRERLDPTLGMIANLVKIEMAYINTNHPDFRREGTVASLGVLSQIVENRKAGPSTSPTANSGTTPQSPGALPSAPQSPGLASPPYSPFSPQFTKISPLEEAQNGGSSQQSKGEEAASSSNGFLSYLFRQSPTSAPPPLPTVGDEGRSPQKGKSGIVQQQSAADRRGGPTDRFINHEHLMERQRADRRPQHEAAPRGGEGCSSPLSERESIETHLIMTLLHSYFFIVRKNLTDAVPKAIMAFLVNAVMEALPTRLVSEVYKEEFFGALLKEDDAIVRQRARCRTALEAYRQAAIILADLKEGDTQAHPLPQRLSSLSLDRVS